MVQIYDIKTSMYKNEKSFHEVSTQYENLSNICSDEQTQISQLNDSKDTHTCSIHSPNSTKTPRISTNKYTFVNPYAILDRVNQGEEFLKFLSKQNFKLDLIYTNFLKQLQKYTDHFLHSLQNQHGLYGTYRRDLIRYIIILQEHINEIRTKLTILQEGNKNFLLFQKHFHKISENKCQLEDLLDKHEKYYKQIFYKKQPMKYQQEFFHIYQKSSIQLRTIEQQRLLAIREQMRFVIHLTLNNEENLFTTNNFDDLLNTWENENLISIDHWSHFSHRSLRSQYDTSLILLDEIKQIVDEYSNHMTLNRIDSIASNVTHSYI